MCMNSSDMTPCSLNQYSAFRLRRPSKQHNFRVHGLINRKRRTVKEAKGTENAGARVEMEIKNLKLYMENQSIIEENNKLRRRALILLQENKALFSQLQQQQQKICLTKTKPNMHAIVQ